MVTMERYKKNDTMKRIATQDIIGMLKNADLQEFKDIAEAHNKTFTGDIEKLMFDVFIFGYMNGVKGERAKHK